MRRLILMRHAKSDWSTPDQTDHARPLALRGRLAAPLMAAWLRERGSAIDAVLTSSSVRTQETLDRMAPLLFPERRPPTTVDATIYEAGTGAILAAVRRTAATARELLVVGHNPGFEDFSALIADGPRSAISFSTATIGVYELAAPWSALGPGDARLIDRASPKELV